MRSFLSGFATKTFFAFVVSSICDLSVKYYSYYLYQMRPDSKSMKEPTSDWTAERRGLYKHDLWENYEDTDSIQLAVARFMYTWSWQQTVRIHEGSKFLDYFYV